MPQAGTYDVQLHYERTWPRRFESFCGTGRWWDYPKIEILDQTEEQVFHILLTPGEDEDEVRVVPHSRRGV